MEDILSSIKRIIAEEGDSAPAARPRRTPRLARPAEDEGEDEILELSDTVAPPAAEAQPEPRPAEPKKRKEPILSAHTAEATRGPLEALSRLVVKPETPGADTLEGLVRELLRPMLAEWLDAHLPGIVEQMVSREIARITAQGE